ncbi:MAG: DUF2147 domain-containing protein [Hyphomicrobium sp.]
MPGRTALALSSVLAGLTLIAPLAHAGGDPTGVWLNDTGRGVIEIKPCGANLCGHVVWVKDEADAAKGCGRQIIGDAKSVGGDLWDNGWIYSPEKKRKYDVELKRLDNGNLRVTGYAGVKFLSKTMIWTPAPADLHRCTSTIDAKAAPTAVDPAAKSDAASVAIETAKAKPADAPETAESQKPADGATPPDAAQAEPAKSGDGPQPPAEKEASKEQPSSEDAEGTGGKGGLKIGDLDLDKVLTRTKSGKCKLDLPWVKVDFDCKRGE